MLSVAEIPASFHLASLLLALDPPVFHFLCLCGDLVLPLLGDLTAVEDELLDFLDALVEVLGLGLVRLRCDDNLPRFINEVGIVGSQVVRNHAVDYGAAADQHPHFCFGVGGVDGLPPRPRRSHVILAQLRIQQSHILVAVELRLREPEAPIEHPGKHRERDDEPNIIHRQTM